MKGYAMDPATGECISIGPQGCECDAEGSIAEDFLEGIIYQLQISRYVHHNLSAAREEIGRSLYIYSC